MYFTDGYGIYPERMPEYDTAFVFLWEDGEAPEVPPWAIKIVLNEEQVGQGLSADETDMDENGEAEC